METKGILLAGVRRLGSVEPTTVAVVDGRLSDPSQVENPEVIELPGCYVAPGYVDLQINGGWGLDLQQDPSQVWALGRRLP